MESLENKRAFRTAISLAVFSVIFCLTAIAVCYFFFGYLNPDSTGVSASASPVVVIDPGHGGRDGGCSSPFFSQSGQTVLEKDLNLSIAEKLAALFRISGYNVIMTRESDVMLDAEGLMGNAKMRDLRARLVIAQRYPDATFISIHCNKFPNSVCSGLQVYYAEEQPPSKLIAEGIQASVISLLQPQNHRVVKPAGSSIYVLDRAQQPSVLIECGFLSNPTDTELLTSPEYQTQLALAIILPMLS